MREPSSTSDEPSLLLWQRLKAELVHLPLSDEPALCELFAAVMTDWSSNPVAMRKVLLAGVRCADLPESVLRSWDSRCLLAAGSLSTGPSAAADGAAECPDLDGDALHPLLQPIAASIATSAGQPSRDPLAMGRQLLQARALCARYGLNFAFFLRQLARVHGIHRASSYLYMKFAESDFPAGLGIAVMKWIAQGFAAGDAQARAIAQRALVDRLSVAQLEKRYGALRRAHAPSTPDRTAQPRSSAGQAAALDAQSIAAHQQRRAELLKQRAQIDAELQRLEQALDALLNPR